LKSAPVAVTPTVTVVSPNGGEAFKVGDTVKIKWNSSNLPKEAKVGIELYDTRYTDKGDVAEAISPVVNTTNTGEYVWKVPEKLNQYMRLGGGNVYKISVASSYKLEAGSYGDLSDRTFSITSSVVATPTAPVYKASFINPTSATAAKAGGEMVVRGKTEHLPNNTRVELHLVNSAGNSNLLRSSAVYTCSNNYCIGFNASTGIRVTVPKDAVTGSYTIRAVFFDAKGTKLLSINSSSFAVTGAAVTPVTKPSITINPPKGGENYKVGESVYVGFNAYGLNKSGNKVTAYLYNPEVGNVAERKLEKVIFEGSGAGDFLLPTNDITITGKYRVSICDEGTDSPTVPGKPYCVHGNYFTVTAASSEKDEKVSKQLGTSQIANILESFKSIFGK
jgi:hypothetical protein